MANLQKLLPKKNKLIIGLMSGTSADGIDAALLRVIGDGVKTRFRTLGWTTVKYPRGFKEFLLRHSDRRTARLDAVARLNILIGEYFAGAARKVARLGGKKLSGIDLIGSHGQTVAHFPERFNMFSRKVGTTMQIGDPSVIAKRTGVVTVGDFRVADVAVGGTGAPLVPYVDFLLFRSTTKNRALLNIGGIANMTVLPRNCSVQEVFALDTGPGNIIVDALMQRFHRLAYDKNGRVARKGILISRLLQWMMRHPYLLKRPPKSTGREMFGGEFVRKLLRRAKGLRREDIVATATAYTALCVYDAYARYVRSRTRLDELFVSGGGSHNPVVMDYLRRLFTGVRVESTDSVDIASDAKEAVCFALLANEAIAGNPANVRGATGAQRPTILGKICLP